jgi:hypothetical protein
MYVRSSETLAEPACEAGCAPCLRSCALARIKRDWWEREEARLLHAGAPVSERAAWLSQLAEAAERLQQLRQDMQPCAPGLRGAAFPAGPRAGRREALLH